MFNVLVTCSGRRNYLVACFREALGPVGSVFVADHSSHAATMLEAKGDAIRVPALSEKTYFDELLIHCRLLKVNLLVSLNDFELPGLARNADRFRAGGVIPMIASPEVVDRCFDKWETFLWLRAISVPTPETVLDEAEARNALRAGRLRFPLVVKPRWGTGSICVEFARDEHELELVCQFARHKLATLSPGGVGPGIMPADLVIQQAASGVEYCFDLVNDLEGSPQGVLTRRKLVSRAGEADRAVTEHHPGLEELGTRMANALRHPGIMDCDAIVTAQGPVVLELNPRFGGSYPFSHEAGANIPAALIAWAQGLPVRPEWLVSRPGVLAAKSDRLIRGEETSPPRA